ncbi:MAG TPA: DUF4349 domain-containing protein, partial [Anaerolineae bacterium]|nr:DUF4349 domain-containing protein [Anaerolineae bacterium]
IVFARLSRVRHPWLVVVVLVVLVLVVVEAGRLSAAQSSVSRAAAEAARYAVTGKFDPAHCADGDQCDSRKVLPKEQREALEDAARLATIYDIARSALGAEAAATARVVVCSSRLDDTGHARFTYDSSLGRCVPQDDAGGPGDKIVVNVAADYALGSFLGSGVGSIRLQAVQELIVERYRTVRIQGLPPTVTSANADTTAHDEAGKAAAAPVKIPIGREQMIVMNGDLQLRVTQADESLRQVKSIATEAGGYVAKSEAWSDGVIRSARAELRVPAPQFQFVMDRLKGLAVEVIRESAVGEDVTEEYVDLEGRLKGVQATAARTEALLEKAEKVDEALKVNTELGRLQEQIEQVTGRMEYLENRAAYSTINVTLSPVVTPTPVPGWLPGATVERAVGFWGTAARFLVDVLIWIVVVGLPLGLVVWLITRGVRQREHKKAMKDSIDRD